MFLVAFGVHVGSPSACSQEAVPALLPSPLPLRDLPLPTWADGEGFGLGNGLLLGSAPCFKTQDKELDHVRVRTRWAVRLSNLQLCSYKQCTGIICCAPGSCCSSHKCCVAGSAFPE